MAKRSARFGWPSFSQLVVTKVCMWFDFNLVLRRWGHPSNYVQLDEFYLSFLRDRHTTISQGLAEAERLNGIQSPHVSIIFMAGFYAGSLVTLCMCVTMKTTLSVKNDFLLCVLVCMCVIDALGNDDLVFVLECVHTLICVHRSGLFATKRFSLT